jgi:hypothetical protein
LWKALVLAMVGLPIEAHGSTFRFALRALVEVATVGVEVKIAALDLRLYRERFLPAYRAAERGADLGSFVELLRTALPAAPEAKPRPSRDSPWDDPELARRRDEAEAARKRGDMRPWNELIRFAISKVRGPPAPVLTRGDIAEALATLESSSVPTSEKARVVQHIAPELMEILCLPWGRMPDPWFNLTRSDLTERLTDRSEVLGTMLFGIGLSGGTLEISPGASAHVMSRADVARVSAELAKIPRPEGNEELARDDAQLRQLVEFVMANPEFALVKISQ